ncbi:MAG: hypothetical protein LBT40_02005 [Deltaproteobacteria bacterium]|nr:hypothetical protein [Deltaproteobacteria bacterium]
MLAGRFRSCGEDLAIRTEGRERNYEDIAKLPERARATRRGGELCVRLADEDDEEEEEDEGDVEKDDYHERVSGASPPGTHRHAAVLHDKAFMDRGAAVPHEGVG